MSRIFISYRRDDSSGYAGRLYDRLAAHFGPENVFMDIDAIEPGLDFVEVIEQAVGSCDVLIALIGQQWLTMKDAQGQRRLDNLEDFVRLEIKAALDRNIRVIPALVGGTAMPSSRELPDDLKRLARRNAFEIGARFHPDVDRLIRVLEKVSADRPKRKQAVKGTKTEPVKKVLDQAASTPKKPAVRPSATPPARPTSVILEDPLFELELVHIPAGEFLMGSDPKKDKDALDEEQPQHEIELAEYYIGKYPVTNVQYSAFVKATGYDAHKKWKDGNYPHGGDNHPAIRLSWHDAVAFCRWLSEKSGQTVRLPTEAEWEKAARGTAGRIYPWGNTWDGFRLNFGKPWRGLGTLVGFSPGTTMVGKYSPRGDSPYGCVDMAGKGWEWCSTLWQEQAYPFKVQDEWTNGYLSGADRRVVRGGSWDNDQNVTRCAFRSWRVFPDSQMVYAGFRVVASPI